MHLLPVVVAVAVGGGLIAAAATVSLIGAARRAAGATRATGSPSASPAGGDSTASADRAAYRWLAIGAVAATGVLVVGLVGMVVLHADWSGQRHARMMLATVVALGMTLASVAFCLALLRLPSVVRGAAAAGRLALDGVVTAAGLWFAGWVLMVEPTRLLGGATPTGCPAILLSSVTAAGTVGLSGIVLLRAPRPRHRTVLAAAGVGPIAIGGLLLAAGVCQSGPAVTLVAAVLLCAGLVVVALASRGSSPGGEDGPDVIRRGSGYAFVPMLLLATASIYHLARGGTVTPNGMIAYLVEGFALVARQSLALREVRGYAHRLIEREAHFRELAHTDPLTGLANRRGLLRALHAEDPDRPRVLLGLDLDGFKIVNDMRGHDVGDAVLVEVGRRLRANLRPGDVAARLGGDEFAVLTRANAAAAERVAERLLGVLNRPYEAVEGRVYLSVSIGLAALPATAAVEDLLRHADLALRYAKQRGKNRIERYDVAYDHLLRRRTILEHELRGAVERDELRLHFQPVVAVPSVRPVGAEALLRWDHPELGAVGPDEFIPLAEECGMIVELGAWVLHQACHQLSLWLAAGHDVWVSVNVSPRELHAPEYVVQVAEALRSHQVPPQRLVLEVTEHAVATDLDELIKRLAALRMTGVRIALDDFGAGYSSLGQLRRLPLDILKIDHSLVAEPEPGEGPIVATGTLPAPMVDVVMRLGHRLGLEVIAEGVTTPAELAAVVAAGCRFGQGRLFGWGVPADHLTAQLESASAWAGGRSPVPHQRPGPVDQAGATAALPGAPAAVSGGAATVPGAAATASGATPAGGPAEPATATSSAQDVRSVDSAREMRQA
ncbi:putative bifunctional diguanylate cyclase/phosphodiesterase [Plantactinospora sp. GCM10030261]|uniref:putative bifunctional diguanylate cyclase/phosphodiesterase n=1 Tax=Plantactinospora sp. GCM10030261 TaxID=3273420 RepID=UPI003617F47F